MAKPKTVSKLFMTCEACDKAIFEDSLGAIYRIGTRESYWHNFLPCMITLSDRIKNDALCACSVDGKRDPKMTYHSQYNCKNDDLGIIKA